MAKPTTREELKQYCLRRLGKPVIEINVDDDQLEDRIDEAIQLYQQYHYAGSHRTYLKHQITAQDIANEYIIAPEEIIGVVRIFPIGDPVSTGSDIFNIRYQIALNDLYSLTSVSMVPYYMTMEHISLIRELLVGRQFIRFNYHRNRIDIDMDWTKVEEGEYLLFEAYQALDPEVYPDIYNDRWLKEYTTVLFEEQWGFNLKKFSGIQMAGGVTYNGEEIYNNAVRQKEAMREQLQNDFTLPIMDMVG